MEKFPVNSYVLLKPPDGAREKLRMQKAGPYIVVGISGDKYSIQDLLTHKTTDTHVSNLCEFRYDSSYGLELTCVAPRNLDGHRGTTTKTVEHGVSGILERLLIERRHLGTVQSGL